MTDISSSTLAGVYGEQALPEQTARYARALEAFRQAYGPGEVRIYRAPGRVNLIGEHTDYHHGYVMPVALDKDVLLLARPRADRTVRLANLEGAYPPRTFEISGQIPPQPVGDWANYVQGPAQLLEQERGPVAGMDALVDGMPPYGVPRGAGLSSSSAVTVVAAVAMVEMNGIALSGPSLADACSRAEWYVGTRGGIMDQFISILGTAGHALFLDCRPSGSPWGASPMYRYRPVPLPAGYSLVVADSGVRHANTGPHYNRRVAEGRIGVRLLARRYPWVTRLRDVEGLIWADLEPHLPETVTRSELRRLGIDPATLLDSGVDPQTDVFRVRARCRHVFTENARVLAACKALEAGDLMALGRLMLEAHASARDDYEISTPELEALVRLSMAQPGTVGARLTGAGWGGCVVALVPQEATSAFAERVAAGYLQETGREAHIFVCRPASGAGLVARTAV